MSLPVLDPSESSSPKARGGFSYPPFVAELALPSNRNKLWVSIASGYGTALVFGVIAALAQIFRLAPMIWPLYALVVFKLITNTLSYVSLRRDVMVLEAGGLNVTADLLAMTGAVYFTGAHASPLFAIYAIEVSVVALLTNLGVTVMVACGAFFMYGTMITLVYLGILPTLPTPLEAARGFTLGYFLTELAVAAVVLGTPTFYTAAILKLLREKERALEVRNRELIEASKQKSQFMANITHELRTPIHGVCGLSDLVETGVYGSVNDKQREAHRMIKRSARSLLRLIDDLLELARSDAGKLAYAPSSVALAELIPSVISVIRSMQGIEGRTLEIDLEDGLPPLFTDRGKLNQILINLLCNAVKFTNDGGRIALRARAHGADLVQIEVEDDGVGIPEAELELIFEPFHQVDGSAERQFGGAGLGLALVRRLATLMGGEVSARSAEGKGSTFTVKLPVRHGAVVELADRASSPAA